MSVWVIKQALPQPEENILQRSYISLPFDPLLNLSGVMSPAECLNRLRALYPEAPPESSALMLDRIWPYYVGMQIEDTIAVPLPQSKVVALARVGGAYYYEGETNNGDAHRMPVEWQGSAVPMASFGRFKKLFAEDAPRIQEITDREARIAILDKLPHAYNRFAKWKKLAIILVIMQAAGFLVHMVQR